MKKTVCWYKSKQQQKNFGMAKVVLGKVDLTIKDIISDKEG